MTIISQLQSIIPISTGTGNSYKSVEITSNSTSTTEPLPLPISIPIVSFPNTNIIELSNIIQSIGNSESGPGIFILDEIPLSIDSNSTNSIKSINELFTSVTDLFQLFHTNPIITNRLNTAYLNNLVYKDSHKILNRDTVNNNIPIDSKRVLDLSPDRLNAINSFDNNLIDDIKFNSINSLSFDKVYNFFQFTSELIIPKLLNALSVAITGTGTESMNNELFPKESIKLNYRLIDYYQRNKSIINTESNPRCGIHQDFGPLTIIF